MSKTVIGLYRELGYLINKGYAERSIYVLEDDYSNNEEVEPTYLPFEYELIIPDELDEAIIGEEVDSKNHIIFK